MAEENISAVLLASGLSRRMGGQDKLLLKYKGKTLIERAVELLDSLPCREKIFVTTAQRISGMAVPQTVSAVINHNPQIGQSESLRLGLGAATGQWYLFLNADQPRLTLAGLKPIFELAGRNTDKIIYPQINGNPCTPVLFPARFRAELLEQTGDFGGRAVRMAHPQFCLAFEAKNPQDFMDIDCLEDYLALCKPDRA